MRRMKTGCMLAILSVAAMLCGCASSHQGVALAPACPSATHVECGRSWDEAMVEREADIVRLPDGRIVGLLPPERSP
jgi:hypothetical protein